MAGEFAAPIAQLIGQREQVRGGLIPGLVQTATQGVAAGANQIKLDMFQDQLNKGGDGLVEFAKSAGIQDAEKYKAIFGSSPETLANGYMQVLKMADIKRKQAEQMDRLKGYVAPVEDEGITGFVDDGPVGVAAPIIGKVDRKPTKEEVAERAFKGGDLGIKDYLEFGEVDRRLGFLEKREEEINKNRKAQRAKKFFDTFGIENFAKAKANYSSTSKRLKEIVSSIKSLKGSLSKIGFTSNSIFKYTPDVLLNALSENGVALTKQQRDDLFEFNSIKQVFVADYIKSISGAQASDKEASRLIKGLKADSFNTFEDFVTAVIPMIEKSIEEHELKLNAASFYDEDGEIRKTIGDPISFLENIKSELKSLVSGNDGIGSKKINRSSNINRETIKSKIKSGMKSALDLFPELN